jgi:hypothetical protein
MNSLPTPRWSPSPSFFFFFFFFGIRYSYSSSAKTEKKNFFATVSIANMTPLTACTYFGSLLHTSPLPTCAHTHWWKWPNLSEKECWSTHSRTLCRPSWSIPWPRTFKKDSACRAKCRARSMSIWLTPTGPNVVVGDWRL